jgi:hypothetical protein
MSSLTSASRVKGSILPNFRSVIGLRPRADRAARVYSPCSGTSRSCGPVLSETR